MGPREKRIAASVVVFLEIAAVLALIAVPLAPPAAATGENTIFTDPNNRIGAVTTDGTNLFVGFQNSSIAIISPSGSIVKAATTISPAGTYKAIMELTYYNGYLYAGNDITGNGQGGGTYYVYKINPTTLAVLDYVDPWNPGGVGFVNAANGDIWVGTGNGEHLYELSPSDLSTIATSATTLAEDAYLLDGNNIYTNVVNTAHYVSLGSLSDIATGNTPSGYRPVGFFSYGGSTYVGDDAAEAVNGSNSNIYEVSISGSVISFSSVGTVPSERVINKGGGLTIDNQVWVNTYAGLGGDKTHEILYSLEPGNGFSVNNTYSIAAHNSNVLPESEPMIFTLTIGGVERVYFYSDSAVAWVNPYEASGPDNNNEVEITITNSQSSPTPAPFQALISRSWVNYTYAKADLLNFRFFSDKALTQPLYSWLESGAKSGTSNFWVKLPSGIGANSAVTIYLNMSATDSPNSYAGEAPQLSATYGQYDNGIQVFDFYRNFNGTTSDPVFSSVASSATASRNDGLTLSGTGSGNWYNLFTASKISTEVLETWAGSMTTASYLMTAQSTVIPASGGDTGITTGWRYEYIQNNGGFALYHCASNTCTHQGSNVAGGPGPSAAQPLTGSWASTPTEELYSQYTNKINQASSTLTYGSTTYASLIFYDHGTGTQTVVIDWVRERAIPPSNTMPTVTFTDVTNPTPPPTTTTTSSTPPPTTTTQPSGGCVGSSCGPVSTASVCEPWQSGCGTTVTTTVISSKTYTVTSASANSNGTGSFSLNPGNYSLGLTCPAQSVTTSLLLNVSQGTQYTIENGCSGLRATPIGGVVSSTTLFLALFVLILAVIAVSIYATRNSIKSKGEDIADSFREPAVKRRGSGG